jgi:hypothetical protein
MAPRKGKAGTKPAKLLTDEIARMREPQERPEMDALRVELLDHLGTVEAKLDHLREEFASLARKNPRETKGAPAPPRLTTTAQGFIFNGLVAAVEPVIRDTAFTSRSTVEPGVKAIS